MKTKAEWRRELRGRVAAMSAEEKHRESAALCRRLLDDTGLRGVRTLGVYLALPDEPDLSAALVEFQERGVRLALPVPETEGVWRFQEINNLTLHSKGPWGLSFPEPRPEIDVAELDAVLVPGRGFTSGGHRLGRGKGIYDRLLAESTARTIGIGFARQLVKTLPHEPHDIVLDEVWAPQTDERAVARNSVATQNRNL